MILLSLLYSLQLFCNLGWCGMKLEKDKIVRYLKWGGFLVGICFGAYIAWNTINAMLSMNGEWIGFWGSILGSIMGGVATYLVMIRQIKNENQNLKMQMDNDKEKELQKERREIMPVIEVEDVKIIEIGDVKVQDKSYTMNFEVDEGFGKGNCNIKFSIDYRNVGNGIAFETKFRKGQITGFYDNDNCESTISREAHCLGGKPEIISKDSKRTAYFDVKLNMEDELFRYSLMSLQLKLVFEDQLGNEYAEIIWFDLDLRTKSIKYKFIEERYLIVEKDNYKKIKKGMTIEEVERLLGKPTDKHKHGMEEHYNYFRIHDGIMILIIFLDRKVIRVLDAHSENDNEEENLELAKKVKCKLVKIMSIFKKKLK